MNRVRFILLTMWLAAGYAQASTETGKLTFKLIMPHIQDADYNPQVNILEKCPDINLIKLNPKLRVPELSTSCAKEYVRKAISASALLSIAPLMGQSNKIFDDVKEVIKGDKRVDFLKLAEQVSTTAGKSILKELNKIKELEGSIPALKKVMSGPLIREYLFIPWKKKGNTFYDSDKVSIAQIDSMKGLAPTGSSDGFARVLTRYLKEFQEEAFKNSNHPVYLLAMRQFFYIDMKGKSSVHLRILLGVKPNPDAVAEFLNENDQVKFDRVVLPPVKKSGGDYVAVTYPEEKRGMVASLLLSFPLGDSGKPTLEANLGSFKEYKDGNFVVEDGTGQKYVPRLEGQAKIPHLNFVKFVAFNPGFAQLKMDLSTQQLTELDTILGAGIRIGKVNYIVPWSFKNEGVNEQFQTEINKTIKAEINNVIRKVLAFGGQE